LSLVKLKNGDDDIQRLKKQVMANENSFKVLKLRSSKTYGDIKSLVCVLHHPEKGIKNKVYNF